MDVIFKSSLPFQQTSVRLGRIKGLKNNLILAITLLEMCSYSKY